jgi:CheY-like chemotaxis protein
MVSEYLGQHGIGVKIAPDGKRGIDALRGGRFDVVLLDVMLPEWDGFETWRRIRATPGLAGLPIIMLTARSWDTVPRGGGGEERRRGAGVGVPRTAVPSTGPLYRLCSACEGWCSAASISLPISAPTSLGSRSSEAGRASSRRQRPPALRPSTCRTS